MSAVVTAQAGSMPGSMNDLMAKLQERASVSIKAAMLDSLDKEQLDWLVAKEVDAFINGSPAKRMEAHTDRRYVHELAELSPEMTIVGKWNGAGHYSVQWLTPNAKYDASLDLDTLPGMIRSIVRGEVKTDTIKEILASPEMAEAVSVGKNEHGSTQFVFSAFIKKYLDENLTRLMYLEREILIDSAVRRVVSELQRR